MYFNPKGFELVFWIVLAFAVYGALQFVWWLI